MAQFDVYAMPAGSDGYLLDCQSDLIGRFETRVVAPLVPGNTPVSIIHRLHPVFEVRGRTVIFAPQLASAVPVSELGRPVTSLAHEHDQIVAAFDLLITGV